MEWEWDDEKNVENVSKHAVSFEAALEAFTDPDGIEKEDLKHSNSNEQRCWRTGRIKDGRIITVVYTIRRDNVHRLISAQERRRERREYEKEKR